MKLAGIVLPLVLTATIWQFASYTHSSVSNPVTLGYIGGMGDQDRVACDGGGGTNPPDAKPDEAEEEGPCV